MSLSLLPFFVPSPAIAQNIVINGAGATFPFPLIDTWRVEYQKVAPDVSINYQSIGSGGGIKQFTEMTVDFGATDAPLSTSDSDKLKGQAVHIPETIGSVVAAINIEGVKAGELKLTGAILADIYLGNIKKWDDEKIKSINPEIQLPSSEIIVVHRSDGSGTTFVWSDYLSKVSTQWEKDVGRGKSVQWPTGIGAPGNEGVANSIKSTENSIGYVELAYALTTDMSYAALENMEGNFVTPSISSTRAAVEASAANLPSGEDSWESVSIVNAPGAQSYPIASFSYLLLYKDLSTNPGMTEEKAKALVGFISWALTDGQQYAQPLAYVPLPEAVVEQNIETLKSLTFKDVSMASSVPEFSIISALVLGGSIAMVMGLVRFGKLRLS